MDRIIVTNNIKVRDAYGNKAEMIFLDGSSALDVLKEGKEIAENGGRLLLDPTRGKGYYRSLAFFKNDNATPDEKTLSMINRSMETANNGNGTGKDSVLSGIYQRKDLDIVKKVLG